MQIVFIHQSIHTPNGSFSFSIHVYELFVDTSLILSFICGAHEAINARVSWRFYYNWARAVFFICHSMDVLISKLYNKLKKTCTRQLLTLFCMSVLISKANPLWLAHLMRDLKLPGERGHRALKLVLMFEFGQPMNFLEIKVIIWNFPKMRLHQWVPWEHGNVSSKPISRCAKLRPKNVRQQENVR